ncbi:hypothetical protein MJO28_016974 [Puccinia striiformis f. sp. tritici]|nr:hypothetical protein MJO28_016974 [Puccinia striiformis f. sp. tritici]
MTLFSALQKLPNTDVIGLNFSITTTPELVLETFDQHWEYKKTPDQSNPKSGQWSSVMKSTYQLQINMVHKEQIVEADRFWRPSDKVWIKLQQIQFVGAYNPPTVLTQRFLQHVPLVMINHHGEVSYKKIYGTFNIATLKVVSNLRVHAN